MHISVGYSISAVICMSNLEELRKKDVVAAAVGSKSESDRQFGKEMGMILSVAAR